MPHFAPTAPSGAPDAPHGAPRLYLKLMVPPKAQYARYIVKVFLSQPRWKGLDVLDPDQQPNTYKYVLFLI